MTERGNPDNLRAAAQRKHQAAVERAERAIRALVRNSEPVNFRAVARLADCSPDFLYRTPSLRGQIQQLRSQPRQLASPSRPTTGESTSGVIRELAARLVDEKRRHREEVAELQSALAAAQGELLQLRRQRPRDKRGAARAP